MEAYCMKSRTKREMRDAKTITMKNGKSTTYGACAICGTKMCRIGKSESGKHSVALVNKYGLDYPAF